jgi:membrane fusion protein, multidrug efflux system
MPQIFPTWLTSPFIVYPFYAFLAFLAFRFIMLLIRRDWPKVRRWAITAIVILLVGYTGFNGYMKYIFAGFQFPFPPGTVIVQNIQEIPFADQIEAIGTTEANESTALTSNVTETVKSINVSEGQFVTQGTIIAELHNDEEQAALIEAQKAFERTDALVKNNALSVARRDTDRAALDTAQARLNDRQIIAPFDGILGLRSISVGDIVNPGTIITTIDDVDPIKLEFSVPETYLAVIKSGEIVQAKSDAYRGTVFSGVVSAIDPRIDPVTRALRVKAEIPNPDGQLRAGMLMRVNIIKDQRMSVAVSEAALVSKGTQKSVMVIGTPDKDGLADVTERPIEIGARAPGYVEVLKGLKANEKVIVEGVIKAHPGGKVHVVGTKSINQTVDSATAQAVPGKQNDLKNLSSPDTTQGE